MFMFMNVWGIFFWALVIMNSPSKFPLLLGIGTLPGSSNKINEAVLMAANMVTSLPILLFFIIFGKKIMRGEATLSGIKGFQSTISLGRGMGSLAIFWVREKELFGSLDLNT